MAFRQEGGYLYIVENSLTGNLKFGTTLGTVQSRHSGNSLDGDLVQRAAFFFPDITKTQLEFYETDIANDELIRKHKIVGKKDWVYASVLYPYLEFLLFESFRDWQLRNSPNSLINILAVQISEEKVRDHLRKALEPKHHSGDINAESLKVTYNPMRSAAEPNSWLIGILDRTIKKQENWNKGDIYLPLQMSALCERLDVEKKQPAYKFIARWLRKNGYAPRRSNGKKVYDINFVDND